MEVDVPESRVNWGKCLRVRVRINVTKRFIRGKKVTIEGGEARWVQLKFERLPNFCYQCGLLSHALRECPLSPGNNQPGDGSLQYRAWLRGDLIRRYPNEPAKHGRGVNQDHRSGAVGGWLETPPVSSDLPREKKEKGTPQRSSQGNSGLTGEETSLEKPKKLAGTLHGSGKAIGSEEKVGKEPSPLSASLPSTLGTRTELADVMLWEKVHVHDLGKTHPEVISSPTSLCTNCHVVTELLGFVEKCLPGFEGKHRIGDKVARDANTFEGHVGTHETLEHIYPQQATLDAPSFEISSGPYKEESKANLSTDSTKSRIQHEHFLK